MEALFSLFLIIWGLFLFYIYLGQKHLKVIPPAGAISSYLTNKLSIVIAVKDNRNEVEKTLHQILNSFKALHELIVVNDRSVDGTEDILKELESKIPNLKLIHIKELPPKWLGKVHALHQGSLAATGDYILFMDADIDIKEETLHEALSHMAKENLDHLALVPFIRPKTFWTDLLMCTSYLLFSASSRPWMKSSDKPIQSIKGVGAFNLVKASSFKKTEGFEWLRMEVADDVALAQLMVLRGGKTDLRKAGAHGPSLDWYENFFALVKGFEKNIVGGFTNYRLTYLIPFTLLPLLSVICPTLIFLSGKLQFILSYLFISFLFAYFTKRETYFCFRNVFFFPIGGMVLSLILLRSFIICRINNGIKWSGTFYPLKDLKEGLRVRIGP